MRERERGGRGKGKRERFQSEKRGNIRRAIVRFQSISYAKERSLILTRFRANEWRSLNNAGNLT